MSVWEAETKSNEKVSIVIGVPYEERTKELVESMIEDQYNNSGDLFNFKDDLKNVKHKANIPIEIGMNLRGIYMWDELKETLKKYSTDLKAKIKEVEEMKKTLSLV